MLSRLGYPLLLGKGFVCVVVADGIEDFSLGCFGGQKAISVLIYCEVRSLLHVGRWLLAVGRWQLGPMLIGSVSEGSNNLGKYSLKHWVPSVLEQTVFWSYSLSGAV